MQRIGSILGYLNSKHFPPSSPLSHLSCKHLSLSYIYKVSCLAFYSFVVYTSMTLLSVYTSVASVPFHCTRARLLSLFNVIGHGFYPLLLSTIMLTILFSSYKHGSSPSDVLNPWLLPIPGMQITLRDLISY